MKPDLCPWEQTINLAAVAGDRVKLREELNKGKDVDTRDLEYQHTPLHWAVLGNHADAVQLLLSHGAAVNAFEASRGRTPLLVAVACGHETIARQLLEAGADADTPDMVGNTPLILAARENRFSMVKLLLEGGSNPNVRDWKSGQTALSLAAAEGHGGVVALLNSHDAATDLADDLGVTPLAYALNNGHDSIARTLAEREARQGSRDADQILSDMMALTTVKTQDPYEALDDETALLQAVKEGREDIVKKVLENNIDVDVRDEDGRTPLSHAAGEGKVEIARILLEKGADVASRDDTTCSGLL
ncbi:hypothetical protein ACHAQH_008461 [Verticillium albo-atrum]